MVLRVETPFVWLIGEPGQKGSVGKPSGWLLQHTNLLISEVVSVSAEPASVSKWRPKWGGLGSHMLLGDRTHPSTQRENNGPTPSLARLLPLCLLASCFSKPPKAAKTEPI